MNEPEATPPAPAGSMCAVHVDRPAAVVCRRCGDFACEPCVDPAFPGLCARCRALQPSRSPFPPREGWTIASILGYSWDIYKADLWSILGTLWLGYVPYAVSVSLPVAAVYAVAYLEDPGSVLAAASSWPMVLAGTLAALLGACFTLGIYAYTIARVRGERADVGVLFGQFPRFVHYLPLVILQILLSLPTQLLQIGAEPTAPYGYSPLAMMTTTLFGLVVTTLIQFATVEFVASGTDSAMRALEQSLRHVRRRPFAALWFVVVLGLGAYASFLCCGLPAIFTLPYTTLAFVTLYLAMRGDAERHAVVAG